jgi:hypothetical protein
LLEQLRDYGEHFEAALPSMEFDEIALRSIPSTEPRPVWTRPVWVAAVAAALIVVAIGLVALLTPLPGDEAEPVVTTPTIPVQPVVALPNAAAPRPIDVTNGITVAPDGSLWATTEAGIVHWDLSAMTPTVYPAANMPTDGGGLSGIAAAPDGTIWASTWKPPQLLRFDGSGWSVANGFEDLAVVNAAEHVTALAVGADNVLWVAVGKSLVRFDGATWEVIEVAGQRDWAHTLEVAPDETLWAAGWENVRSFDGETWTRYGPEQGLPEEGIGSIAVAPDGTVWVGAISDGLSGTAGGLAGRDATGWETVTEHDGLFSSDIRSLTVTEDGTLWAVHDSASDGTPLPGARRAGGALSRFEDGAWSTVFLQEVGGLFGMNSVVDHQGTIWVASRWGIVGYDGDQAIGLRVPESIFPANLDETPPPTPSVIETPESVLTTRAAGPVPPIATCPPDSRPDQPGPVDQARPPTMSLTQAAIDDQSGVMVVLADTAQAGSRTWTFDLCANTWHLMQPDREPPAEYPTLVYDRDSDRTVAVGWESVWSYDVETDAWIEHGRPPEQVRHSLAYHDPSGLVVAADLETMTLWGYDVDADTWTAIPQGSVLPPSGQPTGQSDHTYGSQILTYDRSADLLVLYLGDNCGGMGPYDGCGTQLTWVFDPKSGTWSEEDTVTPEVNFGYGPLGGENTSDASRGRVVIFNAGVMIAYDTGAQEWELLFQANQGPLHRGGHTIAYDPINQRLVMTGGTAFMQSVEPFREDRNDVWAYDIRTGEWITLLDQDE